MLKIAVIGANGKSGRLIVSEALRRGYDVTAVVRSENQSEARNVLVKDVMALTKEDLSPFDVVVDALGFWTAETIPLHITTAEHLCDLLSGTGKRFYVVGGAGSLWLDPQHTRQVVDEPFFPKEYFPLADAQRRQVAAVKARSDVLWTYVSPAAAFLPDAPATGKYVLGSDDFSVNANGESMVSYADYALAMVDLIANGGHAHEQVSVRS